MQAETEQMEEEDPNRETLTETTKRRDRKRQRQVKKEGKKYIQDNTKNRNCGDRLVPFQKQTGSYRGVLFSTNQRGHVNISVAIEVPNRFA